VLKDVLMKRFLVFAVMIALFSAPAFAGKNSQTVSIPMAMQAGTTALTPGDYNVTWAGSGAAVQVTFARKNKAVVTVPAKLVEESNKNEGLDFNSQGGVEILQAIRLKSMTLLLESSPSSKK